MQDPSAVPGAATARLRDLLDGPVAHGTVLHAGADAVYVAVADRCVGVLSRQAVHVPCGIRTLLPALPPIDRDATVTAGEGVLAIGALRVRVARVVDAASVPGFRGSALRGSSQAPRTSGQALARLTPQPPIDELPQPALDALRVGDPAAVVALLGRGSGLTPLGDDVLCGWLATTRLLDDPAHPLLAAEVLRLAPTRTTRLSGELLVCAVAGETIPEFRRLLAALAADRDVDDAVAGLLRVGHTSGAGLALGARLALTRPADHRAAA